jgi:hypothetical protein
MTMTGAFFVSLLFFETIKRTAASSIRDEWQEEEGNNRYFFLRYQFF